MDWPWNHPTKDMALLVRWLRDMLAEIQRVWELCEQFWVSVLGIVKGGVEISLYHQIFVWHGDNTNHVQTERNRESGFLFAVVRAPTKRGRQTDRQTETETDSISLRKQTNKQILQRLIIFYWNNCNYPVSHTHLISNRETERHTDREEKEELTLCNG